MQKIRKPKLGQNFLVDDLARQRIVDALGDLSQRTVVEIGPGHGALTDLLARRCKRLVALELDRSFAAELQFRFRDETHIEVREADVLKTGLPQFAADGETVDVIGNLPYYITSDILLHLFAASAEGVLGRAVLMMQREVADRIAASPGVREYGLLSATTQMYAQVDALFTLPPSAFQPPPDVDSSVVRMQFQSRFEELGVAPAEFDLFLRKAFAQKRKTLMNNLRFAGYDAENLAACWPAALPAQARAEQVPLERMTELHRALQQRYGPAAASAGEF